MSNSAINRFEWFKAVMQAEDLTPTAKLVAGALSNQFANAETGQINPSQETLADYLKVHRDTIKRVLRELRNTGWLMSTGDGGRGKAPLLRMLTPGKIVPFRARKGGADHPAQAIKRGDNLQRKGGQITPSHYKDEQSLEQRGRHIPTERPAALDQFSETKFPNRAQPGLQLIAKADHETLNKWSQWLSDENLPRLIDLPLSICAGNKVWFYLPSKTPPTTPKATVAVRHYFETLQDSEAARHAAQ